MRAAAALALTLPALVLCACAPDAGPPAPAYAALDCEKPFETLVAEATAQPALVQAPVEPAEPYRFWSSADGRTSYLVTQPGSPAHPAVMMQRAVGAEVLTSGCPYGDRAGYDELFAYLDGLKDWRRE